MRAIDFFCVMFWCLSAFAWADSHVSRQPCRPPPLTSGMIGVTATAGDHAMFGDFSYDSPGRKLRFIENELLPNKTDDHKTDVLMLFEEGVFYEIDSKAQSCKKRPLETRKHGMELPQDATHLAEVYMGSEEVLEQGIRMRIWTGKAPDFQDDGHYHVATSSCGCLTVSSTFFSHERDLIFSFLNLETEVKDTHVFEPPSFCEGVEVANTTEAGSFFTVFL